MSKEKLFQVGVKALIENEEGKVLLLYVGKAQDYKNIDHWDIPGGRIQEGYSIVKTLKRELEEEIGVTKIEKPEFFASVISKHEIPLNGQMIGLVLMAFKVRIPKDSRIVLSDEHERYEWVDRKEAAKRLVDKYPAEFTSLL